MNFNNMAKQWKLQLPRSTATDSAFHSFKLFLKYVQGYKKTLIIKHVYILRVRLSMTTCKSNKRFWE